MSESLDKTRELVCFDFSGVLADHQDRSVLIPGVEKLVTDLASEGTVLAIVSGFPPAFVSSRLGKIKDYFKENVHKGVGEGKLKRIQEIAKKYDIADLSRIIFIDDKPDNLIPISETSEARVIGFLGSGKYRNRAFRECKKRGIPFAQTISQLREFLGLDPE
jgi:phosphoglycolate phosphatase-like HAD superfamily hydrolase